jgi:hypothetical protein
VPDVPRCAAARFGAASFADYAPAPRLPHIQYRTNPTLQIILQLRRKALITLT